MAIFTRIKDNLSAIKTKVNQAIASEMNRRIIRRKKRAERKIKSLISGWIYEQPEIQSLLDQGTPGSLNAAFGLPPGDPEVSVDMIVETIKSSIDVLFTKVDKNLAGGIKFTMSPNLLVKLLRLDEGFVTTEEGQDLHWLDWLLTKGDSMVISGYRYVPKDDKGRSGGGYMRKRGSFSVFRVNPEFSGTVDDNFVTRALSGRESQMSSILIDLVGE